MQTMELKFHCISLFTLSLFLVTKMVDRRANAWTKRMEASLSSDSSLSYSTSSEGSDTISSSLKAAEMPNVLYYDDLFKHISSSEESSKPMERKVAGKSPEAISPDEVLISINDRGSGGEKGHQRERTECCCIHGKPCAVGRAKNKVRFYILYILM